MRFRTADPAVARRSAWMAVDARDGFVALAGQIQGATDLEFTVTLLEEDSDADGTRDSLDDCPFDPAKVVAGVCGCGVPDADADADTVADCHDLCPGTAVDVEVDVTGCPVEDDTGDTGDTGDTDDTDDDDTGGDDTDDEPDDDAGECGCASAAPGGWFGLLALAAVRRRRHRGPIRDRISETDAVKGVTA